jgi:ferredoxin-like protein FixX
MAVFIEVRVADEVARDVETVKKLVEICPVNIFAQATSGGLEIIERELDECTLCELCLDAAPPGTIQVIKLYDQGQTLERRT